MAKDFAKQFYNSKAWHTSRDGYIAYRISRDGGMCQKCHKELGYIVHHKIELTPDNINNPDISLNWNNFSYECKHCHDREDNHFIKPKEQERYYFDEQGNIHERKEKEQ